MKIDGTCNFCGHFSALVTGWWAVGIDICPSCNENRKRKAMERVRDSLNGAQKT